MCETQAMEAETTDRYTIRLSNGQEFGPADLEQVLQWGREGRVPIDSLLVPEDGSPIRSVLAEPQLKAIIQAPPTVSPGYVAPTPTSRSAMIPTGNPTALIGYYFAVASFIPGLFFLGWIAIVLGIIGLRRVAKYPEAKGRAHAWVAIIGGLLFPIASVALILLAVWLLGDL